MTHTATRSAAQLAEQPATSARRRASWQSRRWVARRRGRGRCSQRRSHRSQRRGWRRQRSTARRHVTQGAWRLGRWYTRLSDSATWATAQDKEGGDSEAPLYSLNYSGSRRLHGASTRAAMGEARPHQARLRRMEWALDTDGSLPAHYTGNVPAPVQRSGRAVASTHWCMVCVPLHTGTLDH